MPGSSPILALDLGASRIRAGVVRPNGTIVVRADGSTRAADGPAAVISDAIALLERVRAQAPSAIRAKIDALGISALGPLDPATGHLRQPPNLPRTFYDVPLSRPLGEALGLPTAIDRDTHVAALGEATFGAARGAVDFLYLTVSTGIGGAIVADGRLVAGRAGVGGELGHLPIDLDGPPCGCGARGHLEAIASGAGIARAASAAIEAGRAPGLRALLDRLAPEALTARDVAAAEDGGDPSAHEIMERARAAFAAAAVGLVDMFAPELIVVGGSIARAQGDRLLGPARTAVRELAFPMAAARVRIVEARLGDDVGLVGAVPLVAARLAG
ncbi:MAG: glucokinase [Chloroflexota bacterium]|nr:glucokinase [Chloroflexota bacterium]